MKPIDRIVVILFLAAAACGAQTGHSATISGTVTDAVTRLPVQGAVIRAGMSVITTDSSGNYGLKIPSGVTHLIAFRSGYIKPSLDDAIELHDGDALRRDFVLHPAPRISGVITDADTGQRMKGCIIFATRRILSMGEAWYVASGIPTADSRDGSFATIGLDPGEYILEITGCQRSFYPGVDRIEMATPLAVTAMGIDGLDMKVKRREGHKISGTAEFGAVNVQLIREIQGETQVVAQARAKASGQFEFENVPEGQYHIVAPNSFSQVVEVTDHDLADLSLKPVPQAPVSIEFAGEVPSKIRAALNPFSMSDPSLRWLRVTGLPDGYAISGILANGAPVPNGSFSIYAVSRVTVVITSNVQTLTGKVSVPHSIVVAVREPFVEYLDETNLPRTGSDESGNYNLENLAPGKYKVFALTGDEELLQHNEKFLRRKAALAESVEIK